MAVVRPPAGRCLKPGGLWRSSTGSSMPSSGMVFGGVILLTVGAGALSWEHLTHIAATNGHIAPSHLLFLFPTIVDGFMVMSSGVVVRHALTDELGWRTWYAGCLVAA